jgi:hypothetical protein
VRLFLQTRQERVFPGTVWRVKVVRFTLFLIVFVGLASQSRAAVERVVEKNFAVPSGTSVKIDTCQGAIRIEPSADKQIHLLIRQTMAAQSQTEADRRLQNLDLKIEQAGTQVAVKARYRKSLRWAWESWPPVALAYVIKVPRSCSLDLVTQEGDITVCALAGSVSARTENGAIFTDAIDGTVQATSTRGDVSVTACTGELTLTAKSGNVLVGRAGGLTKISGAGGTIEIQNSRGNLHVDADGADIKINFAHPLIESSELRAAGGDIEVGFDLRSACTLTARASTFGEVKVKNLPLAIESGKAGSSHLIAMLNGGGPTMLIDASGGNVRLTGREP